MTVFGVLAAVQRRAGRPIAAHVRRADMAVVFEGSQPGDWSVFTAVGSVLGHAVFDVGRGLKSDSPAVVADAQALADALAS